MDINVTTADLMFVDGAMFLFTPSSGPTMEDTFTSCLAVVTVEDNLIELSELVSVVIDPASLMPNDKSSEPDMVEVTIEDNDGKYVCT